jgi:hypothetical protein
MESFNSRLPDELLNRELFLSLAKPELCSICGEANTTSSAHTAAWAGKPRPHSRPIWKHTRPGRSGPARQLNLRSGLRPSLRLNWRINPDSLI